MSDDGYDSMDAERDRAWWERNHCGDQSPHDAHGWGRGVDPRRCPGTEEPPCLDDDEPVAEQHDHEILMSGESHDPVGLICSCGKRYRVVPE